MNVADHLQQMASQQATMGQQHVQQGLASVGASVASTHTTVLEHARVTNANWERQLRLQQEHQAALAELAKCQQALGATIAAQSRLQAAGGTVVPSADPVGAGPPGIAFPAPSYPMQGQFSFGGSAIWRAGDAQGAGGGLADGGHDGELARSWRIEGARRLARSWRAALRTGVAREMARGERDVISALRRGAGGDGAVRRDPRVDRTESSILLGGAQHRATVVSDVRRGMHV
eukprot:735833-Pyramimonas_sp.AAC.2